MLKNQAGSRETENKLVRTQESMDDEEKSRQFCSFNMVKMRQWSEQMVANSYFPSGKDSRASGVIKW